MADHTVHVQGCDDHNLVVLDLTDEEVATVRKVGDALGRASTCNCQPTLTVRVPTADDRDETAPDLFDPDGA